MARRKMGTKAGNGAGSEAKGKGRYPAEFKAEVVALCSQPGKTLRGVARQLKLNVSSVRSWVKQARVDASGGALGLTTAEREELAQLRKENRRLKEERDILEAATAFFAKRRTS